MAVAHSSTVSVRSSLHGFDPESVARLSETPRMFVFEPREVAFEGRNWILVVNPLLEAHDPAVLDPGTDLHPSHTGPGRAPRWRPARVSGSTTGLALTDTSVRAPTSRSALLPSMCLSVIRGSPLFLADNPLLPHGRLGPEDRHLENYDLWDNL